MKNALRYKWVAMLVFAMMMFGCTSNEDEAHTKRKQMLEAQQVSIDSVEREISRIRDGNGSDMSKWSPDTVKLYQSWQTTLVDRYAERERLINSMYGSTLDKKRSSTPVTPQEKPKETENAGN